MTNKQIKIQVSIFFYVLKFSCFIAQPCTSNTHPILLLSSSINKTNI